MIDLSKTPRCAAYLKAMRGNPEEQGMTEYWVALCVAESFSEKALKKFGGINFHVMKGPALLKRMEEFLEFHSTDRRKSSKKMKGTATPLGAITAAVSNDEIEAAKTPKGGWKAATLAGWGVSWPPPTGWRKRLVENYLAST
jgi:hypothetical protein